MYQYLTTYTPADAGPMRRFHGVKYTEPGEVHPVRVNVWLNGNGQREGLFVRFETGELSRLVRRKIRKPARVESSIAGVLLSRVRFRQLERKVAT